MPRPMETERTAVIAVDLQYECIEADGAWPIYNKAELLANARIAIAACRQAGLPIIYTQHWLDPRGNDALRYEPQAQGGRPLHSVAGNPMAAIHADLAPQPDDIIVRKQRWTGFHGTNMDVVLRRMDASHLIMLGVWTEACFETSVWDALWRDYRITIVKDACSTATSLMHMTSILDLANWLYGGRIIRARELENALAGEPFAAWDFTAPSSYPYTLETVQGMYDSI
ncbi:MAG: cysteine hydrolase [Alphaproteobacteria bacterium]|nr:cysteine hydrolase [Alphaproteobacteria bacterium]